MPSEPFDVQFTRRAKKDLRRLRPWGEQALREIYLLREDPLRGEPKLGKLRGTRALEFTLPGGGAYRAAYVVLHDERRCLVFIVGPHENFYREAERRWATGLALREIR